MDEMSPSYEGLKQSTFVEAGVRESDLRTARALTNDLQNMQGQLSDRIEQQVRIQKSTRRRADRVCYEKLQGGLWGEMHSI